MIHVDALSTIIKASFLLDTNPNVLYHLGLRALVSFTESLNSLYSICIKSVIQSTMIIAFQVKSCKDDYNTSCKLHPFWNAQR